MIGEVVVEPLLVAVLAAEGAHAGPQDGDAGPGGSFSGTMRLSGSALLYLRGARWNNDWGLPLQLRRGDEPLGGNNPHWVNWSPYFDTRSTWVCLSRLQIPGELAGCCRLQVFCSNGLLGT